MSCPHNFQRPMPRKLVSIATCGTLLVILVLEFMPKECSRLATPCYRNIPIYYISPAAEEMLAYGNIVPEWLCPALQEKVSSWMTYSTRVILKVSKFHVLVGNVALLLIFYNVQGVFKGC